MRFLLDEDLSPRVAQVARGLGLDVASVHELGRRGLSDYEQLTRAAVDGRVFVTRNRDDFIHWTREFYRALLPHAGVLIVSRRIPPDKPERTAHALSRWVQEGTKRFPDGHPGPYCIDFLTE